MKKSSWPPVFILVGLMLSVGSVMVMASKQGADKMDMVPGIVIGLTLFCLGLYRNDWGSKPKR